MAKSKRLLTKFQWFLKRLKPTGQIHIFPQLNSNLLWSIGDVLCVCCLGISWFPDAHGKPNNLICRAAFLHKGDRTMSFSPSPMVAQSTIKRWRTKPLLFLWDAPQDESAALPEGPQTCMYVPECTRIALLKVIEPKLKKVHGQSVWMSSA